MPFAVADLDADGDLDFAIAYGFRLNVYWNDGSGVFTEEWVSSIGLSNATSAHQVWSTDCNDDGRLDLLVTGSEREPACLTILRRRADNSGWVAPFAQVVHSNPYTLSAALCDLDGDGDEDYLTDRLIRNATHSLPASGRRRQFGKGTNGTGGRVPTLGADGPFRVGEAAELRVSGGRGGATGVLIVTLVHGGERGPGGWLSPTFEQVVARLPFVLSGTPGVAGTGSWTRPYTVPATSALETRRYVVEIADPAASGGIARTNTLVLPKVFSYLGYMPVVI